ncbi:MAG: D-alanine--D-alanine ligase [Acetobacteraceae bacterium]|nr:D-alanine--D-alanine ligase [Acetobacteraceae bacterium]
MKLDVALPQALAGRVRERTVSYFEFWPSWLFYAPVALHWIGLGLRYGSLSLPSAANPCIDGGGLCGEAKTAILDQVRGPARALVLPYVRLMTGGNAGGDFAAARRALLEAGISVPVVVKPDIGCNGTGVSLAMDADALARALCSYPRGCRLILQAFAAEPGEAGIFYVREPGAARGRITSITLKHAPAVVGDGRSTLRALVLADPRAGRVPHLYLPRLAGRLGDVPARGERVRLVFVGNHCKGSIFENGARQVTPALEAAIEGLARALPEFHFGRFDIRYASLAELRRGRGLRVIEINGAGSEATHVWDPTTTLVEAWRAQLFHYAAAFRIGAANRRRGYRPVGIRALFRLWRLQKRLMATYPLND